MLESLRNAGSPRVLREKKKGKVIEQGDRFDEKSNFRQKFSLCATFSWEHKEPNPFCAGVREGRG
jgi:hypothetical protein